MSISFTEALSQLVDRRDLSYDDMLNVFRRLMNGELSPVQISALTIALRVKRESIEEIAAAAQVMRELVTPVNTSHVDQLVDLCGTGGDGAHSFNISTAAMFVAAAAGATVAKHGGRSVSSSSGSADVLEALGVAINLKPEQVAHSIEQVGVGFMFAPNHHSAMKYAAPVRKELGIRTLFNVLGPLTNPARAKRQVMGVFHADLVGLQARVLQRLGSTHVMIVHGQNGMDELCLECPTHVGELVDGQVIEYTVTPESVGLKTQSHASLVAHSAEESKAKIMAVLCNESSASRDIVIFNAAAALYTGGVVSSLKLGVELAADTIASGLAKDKLHAFIQCTQQLAIV